MLANLTLLAAKLLPNVDLRAGIYNIFGKRYSDPGGQEHIQDTILQNGRTFWVRIAYGLGTR